VHLKRLVISDVRRLIYCAFSTRSLPCTRYLAPNRTLKTINLPEDIPINTGRPFVLRKSQFVGGKLSQEPKSRNPDSSNMPSSPRAQQRSHLLLTYQGGHDIQSFDSTLVPVADRHNILRAVGRLPSFGCRVAADIRIVLVVHTAMLAHRNPRTVDMGQFGFEEAVMPGPSSRKDQRRSGLAEGS
jgi:hypothetical protein